MSHEIAYIEKDRDGRADLGKEKTKRFDALSEALAFAKFVSNNVPIVGKPELRDSDR